MESSTKNIFVNTGLCQGDPFAAMHHFNFSLENTGRSIHMNSRKTIFNRFLQHLAYFDDVDMMYIFSFLGWVLNMGHSPAWSVFHNVFHPLHH